MATAYEPFIYMNSVKYDFTDDVLNLARGKLFQNVSRKFTRTTTSLHLPNEDEKEDGKVLNMKIDDQETKVFFKNANCFFIRAATVEKCDSSKYTLEYDTLKLEWTGLCEASKTAPKPDLTTKTKFADLGDVSRSPVLLVTTNAQCDGWTASDATEMFVAFQVEVKPGGRTQLQSVFPLRSEQAYKDARDANGQGDLDKIIDDYVNYYYQPTAEEEKFICLKLHCREMGLVSMLGTEVISYKTFLGLMQGVKTLILVVGELPVELNEQTINTEEMKKHLNSRYSIRLEDLWAKTQGVKDYWILDRHGWEVHMRTVADWADVATHSAFDGNVVFTEGVLKLGGRCPIEKIALQFAQAEQKLFFRYDEDLYNKMMQEVHKIRDEVADSIKNLRDRGDFTFEDCLKEKDSLETRMAETVQNLWEYRIWFKPGKNDDGAIPAFLRNNLLNCF